MGWAIGQAGNVEEKKKEFVSPVFNTPDRCFLYFMMQTYSGSIQHRNQINARFSMVNPFFKIEKTPWERVTEEKQHDAQPHFEAENS